MMRSTLTSALAAVGYSVEEQAQRLRQLHFVAAASVDALSEGGGALVAAMLQAWPSYYSAVLAEAPAGARGQAQPGPIAANRLDASSRWLPGWSEKQAGLALAAVATADACGAGAPLGHSPDTGSQEGPPGSVLSRDAAGAPLGDLTGRIAVVAGGALPSGCSYAAIIASVQAAGGAGVLVGAPPGSDVVQMECSGADCARDLSIPASMIPPAAADALQTLDGTLGVSSAVKLPDSFTDSSGMDLYLELSCDGLLDGTCPEWDHVIQAHACCAESATAAATACAACQPTSWLALPSLRSGAPAPPRGPAAASPASSTFLALDDDAPPTASADRARPADSTALSYPGSSALAARAQPAASLGAGAVDVGATRTYADSSPVPSAGGAGEATAADALRAARREFADAGGAAWRRRHPGAVLVRPDLSGACGPELGRWVTPYRRRVGRWLTEASHLRPLLAVPGKGDERWCQFRLKTAPWATGWRATLALRLAYEEPRDSSEGLEPVAVQPLFQGGTFDAKFNANRSAMHFSMPNGTRSAMLAAMITGHGSDDNSCAEFCPTTHTFTVNGAEHTLNFSIAGTDFGCAAQVSTGVVPNQHGTWPYGRAGWCPSGAVRPWLVNITGDLHPAGGATNTVTYKGLYQGAAPVVGPNATAGYIMMTSQVVFYR